MENLPSEIQWNVLKYMRHPIAELFLNDNGVQSALEHVGEWENEYENYPEFNFNYVMFSHVLCHPMAEDDTNPRSPDYHCSCHDCDWCEQTQGGRYPYDAADSDSDSD